MKLLTRAFLHESLMHLQFLAGDALTAIWDNPRYAYFTQHRPMLPTSIVPGGVLFLGINPSYSPEPNEDLKQGPIYYQWDVEPQHPYYRAHATYAKHSIAQGGIAPAWSNLDMLYMRHTSQDVVADYIDLPDGLEFIWKQLELTKKLLLLARPQVLIVANRLAATLLGKHKVTRTGRNKVVTEHDTWLGFHFNFNEEIGTYCCPELGNVPVFFTRPFSGRGNMYTDKEDRKRMAWQIRRVLQLPPPFQAEGA